MLLTIHSAKISVFYESILRWIINEVAELGFIVENCIRKKVLTLVTNLYYEAENFLICNCDSIEFTLER